MANGTTEDAAVVCAENVALLHALHVVPLQPAKIPIDGTWKWKDGYRLTFATEQKLAGALSFLLSISDNPDRIAAVCIEEDHDANGLRVLLAVNKKQPESASGTLETLKSGMERVLAPLARVGDTNNKGERDRIEKAVFSKIIAMCNARILTRLRLSPSSWDKRWDKTRPPFSGVLQRVVDSLQSSQYHGPATSEIITRTKAVIKLLNLWPKYKATDRLKELVDAVCRLKAVPAFKDAINAIPNVDMDPDARKGVVNIVQKVARYREVARFLVRTARAEPLLRRATVVAVNLPREAFAEAGPGEDYQPDIAAKLRAVCGAKDHSDEDLDNTVFRYLQTTRANAADAFVQQARETLDKAKIHAEIQLVVYCEREGKASNKKKKKKKKKNMTKAQELLPPRVVRSNKDACFLCSAFLQMHHTMYTSRQHGRLYPGWKLPRTLDVTAQRAFNEVLAREIRQSIATLKQRRQRTTYNAPNESTLTTLPSTTSVDRVGLKSTSKVPETDTVEIEPEIIQEPDPGVKVELIEHAQSPTVPPENLSEDPTTEASSKIPTDSGENGELQDVKDADKVEDTDDIPDVPPQGASISGSVREGMTSSLHSFGALEVIIEYEKGQESSSKENSLGYKIERLDGKDEKDIQRDQTIDTQELYRRDEIICKLDSSGCIYLVSGALLVRIAIKYPEKN